MSGLGPAVSEEDMIVDGLHVKSIVEYVFSSLKNYESEANYGVDRSMEGYKQVFILW